MTMTEDNERVEANEVVADDTENENEAESAEPSTDVDPNTPLTVRQVADLAGVRYQMVRNYAKMGMIPSFETDDGKVRIKLADAVAWVNKYQENKAEREQKRQAKLAAELLGTGPAAQPATEPNSYTDEKPEGSESES